MAKDFSNISHLIEDQFPAIYREEGELMVQFLKAYYEFLDENYSTNKNVLENIDVDYTSEEFIEHFKKTYLSDFPFVSSTDARFMIKHIVDYYRSKGTIESTKLLIQLLFGEETDVYIPNTDIFKPSDSQWVRPEYLEITKSPISPSFIGKEIIGSRSGAKAIAEGLVTKRLNGKFIDVLYLSSIRGFFVRNDVITVNGEIQNSSPRVLGSLNSIELINGGRDNSIGDIFDIIGDTGVQGKGRVSAVFDETGRVDFELVNGGSGYTLTDRTDVYISDAILNLKNEDFEFIRFEKVSQKMEELKLLSVANIEGDLEVGKYFLGMNESGVQVANGTILEFTSGVDPDSNTEFVDVQLLIESGTFDLQERFTLTSNTNFLLGEILEEESTTNLTLSTPSGTFNVGDRVEQKTEVIYDTLTADIVLTSNAEVFQVRETIAQFNANSELSATAQVINKFGNTLKVRNIRSFDDPGEFVAGVDITGTDSSQTASVSSVTVDDATTLYTAFGFGFVESYDANTNLLVVKPSWGIFEPDNAISVYANTDLISANALGTSAVSGVDISEVGARGVLSSQPANNEVIVENIFGAFTAGKKIRGDRTRNISEIVTIANEGATDVWLNGLSSANGVIDLIANTTAIGTVIDQNTSAVGVHGNTAPFFSSGQVSIESTLREIDSLSIDVDGLTIITTTAVHSFANNDTVIIDINLQQDDEVKFIQGIFTVNGVPSTTKIKVQLDPEETAIVNQGNFAFFATSVKKTTIVPIRTDRSAMISPPRNANGSIIEVDKTVETVSTGTDAGFRPGSLENEETVFLATDIIGSNNVVGVPYTGIQINAANSGVGFLDSIIVDGGGSSYSNGQILTFTGGGYAAGDPLVPAQANIFTDGTGAIIDIEVVSHGQGYWAEPEIVWPGGNSTANLDIIMDYGYGFPKSPNGDLDTILIDMWTLEPFTIGTVSSLDNINPGFDYNQDPFVLMYNRYVAGFRRTDFLLTLSNTVGSYRVGELLTEEVPGDGASTVLAKGYVLIASGNQLIVRRTSFNTAFTDGYELVGTQSSATGTVVSVESIEGSFVMGDNSIIDAEVIAAEGIAKEIEIIDSGYGYEPNEIVVLRNDVSRFIMNGTATIQTNGTGSGFWKTKTSHLNSNNRVHDNVYFQEFSYDIITGKGLNKYENILKKILHVAGTRLFGTVEKRSQEKILLGADSDFETIVSANTP